MKVLLVGSYNGQDSLGDKCLLRCVIERIRHAFGPETEITTHVHNASELYGPLRGLHIAARPGVQTYLWRWEKKFSRLIRDGMVRQKIAAALFRWVGYLFMLVYPGGRRALQDLRQADAIVIYGGTNFSRQWWHLNTPAYILTCRWAKAPLLLAPQQYGPMDAEQLKSFKDQLLSQANWILCRNLKDVELLGLENKKKILVKDEVFSNTSIYPISTAAKRSLAERDPILLVNMRFSNDFLFDSDSEVLDRFCLYVGEISQRLQLKIKLFCMSGWTFADDLAGREILENHLNRGRRLDVLAYTDEFDLLREATRVRACISMSFHGAIICMIGGCPSIPVTIGDYYDYKYIGFASYNPSAGIPLISLDTIPDEEIYQNLVAYLKGFQQEAIFEERVRSNMIIDEAYKTFAAGVMEKS